mgnify:CR=1 FL=1
MNLREELRQKSNEKFKEVVKEFAKSLKERLFESAEKGLTEYTFFLRDLPDNMQHFMSPKLIRELEKYLDGLNIEQEGIERPGIFGMKYRDIKFTISWE